MIDDLLRNSYNDMVRALVRALDMHDPGEAEHAERVSVYSVATAERMGFSDEELVTIRRAALLHDVGKIAIERSLLRKLGELDDADFQELKLHAALAEQMLQSLPWLSDAVPMIRHHHERWDGGGYPDQLAGEAIPVGARIIAVAEAFDHIATGASWRNARGRQLAIQEMIIESGKQFDPTVVQNFLAVEELIQPEGLN